MAGALAAIPLIGSAIGGLSSLGSGVMGGLSGLGSLMGLGGGAADVISAAAAAPAAGAAVPATTTALGGLESMLGGSTLSSLLGNAANSMAAGALSTGASPMAPGGFLSSLSGVLDKAKPIISGMETLRGLMGPESKREQSQGQEQRMSSVFPQDSPLDMPQLPQTSYGGYTPTALKFADLMRRYYG